MQRVDGGVLTRGPVRGTSPRGCMIMQSTAWCWHDQYFEIVVMQGGHPLGSTTCPAPTCC